MNKIMTRDFSKMSVKNHFKMKSSKLLQNVDFKCKQPGEGVCLLCRIHYQCFWVQPLEAFAWDCFYAIAWNMNRERAECGNSRIPGLFGFEFSPVLSERNLVHFFPLKSLNFNTITNLILSNWLGKLLTIGAPLKCVWGVETISERFDQYHLGKKINH